MKKNVFKSVAYALATLFVATIALTTLMSCEDTDTEETKWQSEDVEPKPGDPSLTFVPIVDNNRVDTADVVSKIYDHEVNYSILASIEMEDYDYMIERKHKDLDYSYCNMDGHKTVSGKKEGKVTATFSLEDGNLATVKVDAKVLEEYLGVPQPYWLVRDVNITNIRNYKERGDSLWTEVTAKVDFQSYGIGLTRQEALTLKDSVLRVMMAKGDSIVDHRYEVDHKVIAPDMVEIDVVKINIWESKKETKEAPSIQLLPLLIEKINLPEQETTDLTAPFTTTGNRLDKGTPQPSSEVELSTNFTNLVKRTDVYSSVVSSAAGNTFHPEYRLPHYGVTYVDEDTTIVFDLQDWNIVEAGNVVTPTTPSRPNSEWAEMTNNVTCTYMGYVQGASETGRLYKEGDVVTGEWDAEASWLKVVGTNVLVHGEWVKHHTIGEDEREMHDTTYVRGMVAGTWEIYASNITNTTGANSITKSKTSKRNGAWSWSVVTNKVTENVTFASATKQNVYTGTEYADITLTREGKKLVFRDYSYEYTEGSVNGPTKSASSDEYDVYKQNTTVSAVALGNQSISATSVGTIYVTKSPFNPEAGKFEGAGFACVPDPDVPNPAETRQWKYGAVLRFEFGSYALPISREGKPDFTKMTWWPGITDASLNGAYYVERQGKWYPVIASDQNHGMEWSVCGAQGGYCLDMLSYAGTDTFGDWNNNDKNSRGQHTVLTNRLRIDNDKEKGIITLYYNNVKTGSWAYYK